MNVLHELEWTTEGREIDTGEVVIRYTVNVDEPENPFLNIYHFYVYEASRSESKGSEAMEDLLEFARDEDLSYVNIVIQDPDGYTEDFLKKFGFDEIRGPYERDAYDNPLYDGTKRLQ